MFTVVLILSAIALVVGVIVHFANKPKVSPELVEALMDFYVQRLEKACDVIHDNYYASYEVTKRKNDSKRLERKLYARQSD